MLLLFAAAFVLSRDAWTDPSTAGLNSQASGGAVVASEVAYVPNAICLGCHAEQAKDWSTSHHAQAMAEASPTTVRGDFGGSRFKHAGVTSRFFRRGDTYFVHTDGPDGKLADFEVRYTFGVEPLQQYLVAMPGGRLQALAIAWDVQKKRWFHLNPNEKTPPGDVLHWTGRYQTANTLCIVCHTTGYERRYDAVQDRFDSTWHEPNVSCQACHGPGASHVGWARATAANKSQWVIPGPRGLLVSTQASPNHAPQDICTPCHSRRSEVSVKTVPGQPLLDHVVPAVLREGLYHADGQQLDEVFVDGSFRQSKMFRMGVTCSHCHNPHTGKTREQGNALCLQCHAKPQKLGFPSAAGAYDTPQHHRHAKGSQGAQCVNCHMPSKLYMGIQPRPDHSLRIPRPDLSVSMGVPNACNGCHTKKTAAWAAEKVAQWYGPKRRLEVHAGEAFASYRAGKAGAAQALVALIADDREAAIVRATALEALRADPMSGLPVRIAALSDPSAQVRAAATDSLAALEPRRRMEVLGPKLSDPLRAMRLAAVLSLSTIARSQLEPALSVPFDKAKAEYIAVHSLAMDMPGNRLSLGLIYQNTGETALAEQHYRGALKLDPDFSPARLNLAQMLASRGQTQAAVELLKVGAARQPQLGELQYSLGLLLAQVGDSKGALIALQQAARHLPQRARVQYNLGLALQQSGQDRQAERAMLAAAGLDATDPDVLYALAAFYFHRQQFQPARNWAGKLRAIYPQDQRLAPLERALAARGPG